MKNKKQRSQCSSDSSGEDQPLRGYKSQHNINSYGNLLKHSLKICDFCDEVFNNKYKILIHNAKHIIIPLEKQTLHQCPECLFQFRSLKDLDLHTNKKHHKTLPQHVPDLSLVKVEYNEIEKLNSQKDCQISKISQDLEDKPLPNCENEQPKLKIKQRIVFEDDLFENELMNGNMFDSPLLIDSSKYESVEINNSMNLKHFEQKGFKRLVEYENFKLRNNEIVNSTDLVKEDVNYHSKFKINELVNSTELTNKAEPAISNRIYKSVHYSKLIDSGVFKCQWCMRQFPNRIELLKHEPVHMRMRQFRTMFCSVCERYIAGNYRNLQRHIANKHPDQVDKKFTLHKCPKCGLKYHNYSRHLRNYHFMYLCKACGKSFKDEKERSEHIHDHLKQSVDVWDSKTVKMCDLCYSFMKNKQNLQYQWLGEVNEVGVRQECHECGNKFFEVNLVKKSNKLRDYSREKGKKPLTNEERLKKLQIRLKNLNKMNKF